MPSLCRQRGRPAATRSSRSAAGGGIARASTDTIADRFLRLDDEVVEVLGVAALVGRRIDLPVVQRVTGRRTGQITVSIDAAVAAGLLRSDESGRLAFVHDLVREAAAASVPHHRRALHHATIAAALEQRGDDVGAVLHVLDGFDALEPRDAVLRAVAAGQHLYRIGAFEDGLAIATRLLHVVEQDPRATPAETARAQLLVAWANGGLGNVVEEKHHAGLAGAAALDIAETDVLAEAALTRAGYAQAGMADPTTLGLLDAALARVPATDIGMTAQLIAMRAFYLFIDEGHGTMARAEVAKAVDMAHVADDPAVLAEVLSAASFVGLAGSDVGAQSTVIDEMLDVAPAAPFRERVGAQAAAHRQGVVLRLQLGDRDGFERHRSAIADLATRGGFWLYGHLGTMWEGLACLLDGDFERAGRLAAGFLGPDQPDHNMFVSGAGQLFAALRWQGALATVTDGLAAHVEREGGLPIMRSLSTAAMAIVGDVERARGLLAPLLDRPDPLVDDSTLAAQCAALVEACALTGAPCPPIAEEALAPFSGQLVVTSWGVEVPGAADRFLAVLSARRGDVERARARFVAAEALEHRLSTILPQRTRAWRHALLGDVPAPSGPDGLRLEIAALRAVAP